MKNLKPTSAKTKKFKFDFFELPDLQASGYSKIKRGTDGDVSPLFYDGRQVERTSPHFSSLPAIFHHRQK